MTISLLKLLPKTLFYFVTRMSFLILNVANDIRINSYKNISMFSSEDEQKNCLFKVVFGDTITYLFTL